MTRVAIAFGSNLGDRESHISSALRLLERAVAIDAVSSLYETAPMYVADQPAFLNGVVVGDTDLGPIGLVSALKEIEREVGRTPAVRNGPREIDLDLLLYGGLVFRSTGGQAVTVPHPSMSSRRFVLEPLAEVWADAFVPMSGFVRTLLATEDVQSQEARRIERAAVPLSGTQ